MKALCLMALALPGVAWAGGAEVEALALAALEQPETLVGGSLVGPPSSRATWFSLGGVRPFSGEAMVLFSTGRSDSPLLPGTDLGAVGVDDDIAGVNFSLSVPATARSLRFAVRVIAPPGSASDPDSMLDRARVEVTGDPIALDPWERGSLFPGSAGLEPDLDGLLDGTPYEGAWLSPWLEAMIPVTPLSQIPVSFEVRDGGGDPRGDFAMLLDGIAFDAAEPTNVGPGVIARVGEIAPLRAPDTLQSRVLVSGRDLPPDLGASLVDAAGIDVLDLGAGSIDWRSSQRVWLTLPALEPGTFGLRLRFGEASMLWPSLLRLDTPPPSIQSMRPDVSAPDGGGLAVLTGDGFFGVSSVRVGGQSASFAVISAQRIELVVPPGEGSARVLVIADGGSVERADAMFYSRPPEEDEAPSPGAGGGPTVVDCSLAPGGAPSALLLAAFLLTIPRRRR